MMHCYLLPMTVLLPWTGCSLDARDDMGSHCCWCDRAKSHCPVLAPFHAAAHQGAPLASSSMWTGSASGSLQGDHAATLHPWVCAGTAPLHRWEVPWWALGQPGRALQRHPGQSFVSAKENSLCSKGTACFLMGNWSVLFPGVPPTV